MSEENGKQRTINEMIHDDLMYVKKKVDHIVTALDQKAEKADLDKIREKQDKLVSAKDGIYGSILVLSHWAASIFN